MKSLILTCLLFVSCAIHAQSEVKIQSSAGWLESCYATWSPVEGATGYNVYYRNEGTDTYHKIDGPLVRQYADYSRADVVGITAGTYRIKIVPVGPEGEMTEEATESSPLEVKAHDRSGFAHFKSSCTTFNPSSGVGAYRNDGTLKAGAKVLYVYAANAKTITHEVVTSSKGDKTQGVGLQGILKLYEKGQDTTPLDIRIIGTLKASDLDYLGSSSEGLLIKGRNAYSELNITIEGIGQDATIHGFGFQLSNAASVEIRNLAVMWCMDDAVSLNSDNTNLWIHNLDLFYGQKGSDSDQAKGDGTIDLKDDTRYTTISYNHLWDSGKASLCGMKSESGPNFITYHHNWFDHSDSRHPRVRTMSVHVYNNYYDGNAKYGVGAAMNSDIFVESNYFRNCKYPMLISMQGSDVHNGVGSSDETKGTFSGENGGIIKALGNYMTGQLNFQAYDADDATRCKHFDAYVVSQRSQQVPATVTALQGAHIYNNFDTDPSLMYQDYVCHEAAEVPTIVCGNYGAGRCQHGDFAWTFDEGEDSNYEVINALSSAISSYQGTLVGIYSTTTEPVDPQPTDPGDDDEPTEEQPQTPIEGTVLCHFTDKAPSTAMVSVAGNYSNSHESLTYQGVTYGICVKMETSTQILIRPTSDCTITLLFGGDAPATNSRIKIDGVVQNIDSNGRYSFQGKAGTTYTLTKGDTLYLFAILFQTDGASDILTPLPITRTHSRMYDLQGRPISKPTNGRLHIQGGKIKTTK